MEKLYESILDGLRSSEYFYNANSQKSFDVYLKELQSSLINLRNSYKSNFVKTDYSIRETQASYLIAYYPQYAEMTLTLLEKVTSLLNFEEEVKACFFGAGPCPEIAGLAQFLTKQYPKTRKLSANVYDIASEQWNPSREVTRQYIVPALWKGELELNSFNLDLRLANSFQTIKEAIKNSTLFIFQNCLNEISEVSDLKKNIDFLLDEVPVGSFLIIADLSNYSQNRTVLTMLANNVRNRHDFDFVCGSEELRITTQLSIPPLIKDNLLTWEDGLKPRKNVDLVFLAAHKINYRHKDSLV